VKALASTALLVLVAACAGPWAGRNLPEGTSMAEVEATMGIAKESMIDSRGETVWFYPTAPEGRDTWAARFGPDGLLVKVEQRLTKENIGRVVVGSTTQQQVQELFGSPWKSYPAAMLPMVEWDYRVMVDNRKFDYLVRFSYDGVVREAYLLHDPIYDSFQRN
jgi:hypothetical protein